MALSPMEMFTFSGVDSRGNPLNLVQGKSLRCRNWTPRDSGVLELRWGFTTVTMTGSTSTASIHTLIPYSSLDASGNETKYLMIGQSNTVKTMAIATGAVSNSTVRGTAFGSTSPYGWYVDNARVHIGNGSDQKWFDGTTWRDNGLRALTAAEVASVGISAGVPEMTTAQNSSVTLTQGAGGSFGTSSIGGMYFFVCLFAPNGNEVGPATQFTSSGRINITSGSQKVTVAGMPTITTGQRKLIARTEDGAFLALFCTNTSTTGATLTRSGTTVTVTATAHGLSSNDVVIMSGFTDTKYNSTFQATVTGANTFTITLLVTGEFATSDTGGTVKRIVSVDATTSSVDVTLTTTASSYAVNQSRGVAPNVLGGYQYYASIWNKNGGDHVGNRIAIGPRFTTTVRMNAHIFNLPSLAGFDSEWVILIGRTGDGGEIPYAVADSGGNWGYCKNADGVYFSAEGNIDGTAELPTRNGIVPAALNMFAHVDDRNMGATFGLPYLYRSGSPADNTSGDFVGRPEQAWALSDFETFPTAKGLRCVAEYMAETVCGSLNECAVLSNVQGQFLWRGPWYGCGFAGKRSFCRAPYGFFWVTGSKELATLMNGEPVPVSDEYQAALLGKIGDAFIQNTEMQHVKDILKGIDHILIKCQDANGNPFEVIHDFKLRDAQSPQGQGYELAYSAPLTSNFVITKVADSNDVQRLWAGSSTGNLYQLHSGSDDAGTQFSADAVYLLNAGPDRPSVPKFRWYGDSNISLSVGRRLDDTLASIASSVLASKTIQGEDGNSYYESNTNIPTLNKAYLRIQLTSHSADGSLALNDPPHCPLETYGKLYLAQGLIGQKQGI